MFFAIDDVEQFAQFGLIVVLYFLAVYEIIGAGVVEQMPYGTVDVHLGVDKFIDGFGIVYGFGEGDYIDGGGFGGGFHLIWLIDCFIDEFAQFAQAVASDVGGLRRAYNLNCLAILVNGHNASMFLPTTVYSVVFFSPTSNFSHDEFTN